MNMESLELETFEVEMKFPIVNPAEIERKLIELGGVAQAAVEQVDLYFSHPQRNFAVTDEAFRMRCVNEDNFLTYKGPKLGQLAKTRKEIEIPLGPGGATARKTEALLVSLGFGCVARVRKRRRHFVLRWESWNVEAVMDDVQQVGQYLEIEVLVPQDDVSVAQDKLLGLAECLGLAQSERRSYLELLLNSPEGEGGGSGEGR